MKYRKSDNLAIATVLLFILAIIIGPKTQTFMTVLGVLALAAILLTVLLKLFYFGRDKYVPSRKRPKGKKPLYLEDVQPLSAPASASDPDDPQPTHGEDVGSESSDFRA